jgi:hypothetical protein
VMKGRKRRRTRTTEADTGRAGILLERVFQRAFGRRADPWPLVADLVVERLTAQGASPSPADRRAIEKAVRTNGVRTLRIKTARSRGKPLTVTLTDADGDAIVGRLDRVTKALPAMIRGVVDEFVPRMLSTIRRAYPPAIRADERRYRRLEAEIRQAWREPLASLELLIELTRRMMRTIDDYCAEHPAARPKLVHVLARLHIRSAHVAREILTLLRCGYPDAAMARWRTLHEIATVMCLLSEHEEECAGRYLDHQVVQEYEDAKRYQDAAAGLGRRPLSDARVAKLLAAREAMLVRHGKPFRHEFGWAASALKMEKPTFLDIEKAVGRSHLRPYYRLAGDNVHAGIMGALYKLGTKEAGMLLLEPTPVGLEEPGQNTALALALVLAAVARVCPAIDALVMTKAALALADEAVGQFVSVGRSLKVTTHKRPRSERPWGA